MDAEITIKNYRCFPDSAPARFTLKDGFTAFVGPNNSGKSSLLRFFYEFRDIFRRLAVPGSLQTAVGGLESFNWPPSVLDTSEPFHKGNTRDLLITINFPHTPAALPPIERIDIVVPRASSNFTASLYFQGSPVDREKGGIGFIAETVIQNNNHIGNVAALFELSNVLLNTLYLGSFRNPLNIGGRENYYDIQIGQAFITAWKGFKTGATAASNEAARRVERDIGHIFDFRDFQINPGLDDHTLQMFINDLSFKMGEVGSGMAQFIIVLANAAIKKPSYILIDEPELNLHPALQMDFLTTLASYAPAGVMFATHSLGLARSIASQIYSLRKLREFETQIAALESVPRLSEFLGEMSFGGYQELGFKRVLLVEGPTEVTSLQQLLRLLGKDHQIVLLQLGGSSLINGTQSTEVQLQELTRISNSIAAVIDSERTSAGAALAVDREAFKTTCGGVGIDCHVLDRRALENYWTESAVRRAKGASVKALGHFEKLAGQWGKSQNWRIAREMTKEELLDTDLGKFLASL